MKSKKTLRSAILIAAAALLWSLDGVFRNPVSQKIPGSLVVFCEFFFASVVLLPFALFSLKKEIIQIKPKHFLLFFFLGACGSTLAGLCFTKSITLVGSSAATLLEMAQPLVVLAVSYFVLKEKHGSFFYFVCIWVLINAVILSVPDFQFGFESSNDRSYLNGILLGFVAVFMWGLATVAGKYLLNSYKPIAVAFWRGLFAAGVALIYAKSQNTLDASLILANLPNLLGLATLVGALPLVIYYYGLRNMKAGLATFIELLYALFGIFIPLIQGQFTLTGLHVFASVSLVLLICLLVYIESELEIGPTPF